MELSLDINQKIRSELKRGVEAKELLEILERAKPQITDDTARKLFEYIKFKKSTGNYKKEKSIWDEVGAKLKELNSFPVKRWTTHELESLSFDFLEVEDLLDSLFKFETFVKLSFVLHKKSTEKNTEYWQIKYSNKEVFWVKKDAGIFYIYSINKTLLEELLFQHSLEEYKRLHADFVFKEIHLPQISLARKSENAEKCTVNELKKELEERNIKLPEITENFICSMVDNFIRTEKNDKYKGLLVRLACSLNKEADLGTMKSDQNTVLRYFKYIFELREEGNDELAERVFYLLLEQSKAPINGTVEK